MGVVFFCLQWRAVPGGSGRDPGGRCGHYLHHVLLYQQVQQEEGDGGGPPGLQAGPAPLPHTDR